MILKIAFALITILAAIAGIIALVGDPNVAAGFSFGAAVVSAVGIAYLLGRDGKKTKPTPR
ncbi:hypothetical protein [Nesterenkonia alba]|uniref:hypothetical protein n=1 Tax=Nesterenkonia alba TaxID=515814 RepID=UPI0003B4F1B4|nr:hypothetical protein [Nesterenkonia alba]